ncbi:MAG: hypothetical protein KQ78_00153 [Candidatus Izimaplasma bacterium HR2]|nr:MAG: hypothetical protein KQ78_00153 [Candidatus Izimaplasma bacterium HR2]
MHKMENTPMIITIIGLVMEGIAVVVLAGTSIFMLSIKNMVGFRNAIEADLSQEEYLEMIKWMDWIGYFILVVTIVLGVFLILNLYLFPRLMKGKYTEEQAKKIYLYQAIWGGINLVMNQITGILYLISGVQGYNGRKDIIEVRDGI